MSTEQDFLAEVEAFLDRYKMAPANLGSQALKDPKFVSDLRNGRSPSLKTIEKLRLWMRAHEEQGRPAAPPPQAETTREPPPMAGNARRGKRRRRGTVPRVAGSEVSIGGTTRRRGAGGIKVVFWLVLLSGLTAGAYFYGPRAYRAVANLLAPSNLSLANPSLTNNPLANNPLADGAPPSGQRQSVESRLEALEARPAGGPLAASETERLDRRLDGLARRLRALEKQPRKAPGGPPDQPAGAGRLNDLGRQLEALGTRLAALESGADGGADLAALRLVFALEGVRRAALSGEAFEAPLARLAGALPATEPGLGAALERLHPFAARGIPLARVLREDFAAAAEQALSGADSRPGQGWWGRLLGALGGLVRIRATDSATAKGDAAIIMTAQKALRQGDLGAVLTALDGLSAPAASVERLAAWRAAAARRLAALVLLDQLEAAVDTVLAKGTNGSGLSATPTTKPAPGGRR